MEIKSVEKSITPFGYGLFKLQLVVTCRLDDNAGRRYESKGAFYYTPEAKLVDPNYIDYDESDALVEEGFYMKHFLKAIGFPCQCVTNSINEFIHKESI